MIVYDYQQFYKAGNGARRRSGAQRAADVVNAKEFMVGDGTNTVAQLKSFFDKVGEGYGTTPIYPASVRQGYLPGGIYRGDNTEVFHLAGQGLSLKGDGPISQIINATVQVDQIDCHVESLRIVGDGAGLDQGIGLDIQAGAGRFFDVNVYRKDIGIANNRAANPGGFASNLTLFGGFVRDCNVGVSCAASDYRAIGQRVSGRDVAFDYYDTGGIELVGCHLSSSNGPSLLVRGHRVDFNATSTAGSAVLSSITVAAGDYSTIKVGDVVGYQAELGVMQGNSRVVTVTPTSITLDRTVLQTRTGLFSVNEYPTESFFVGVTVGSGGGHRYEHSIASIANSGDADNNILVTLTTEHEFSVGMTPITFEDTGIAFYDNPANRGWVLHVPTSKSIVVTFPYNGSATTGTLFARADSAHYLTSGPSVLQIGSLFTTGGNQNGSKFKGGVGYNFIGTRLKARKYMHGCRPFKADVVAGNNVLTNVTIPTSEIRLGTHIALPTVLAAFTRVTEIISPTSIRVDMLPVLTVVQAPITSPEQPNNIFHLVTVDNQGPGAGDTVGNSNLWRRLECTPFQGPGSLVGWADMGEYPISMEYDASEDGMLVGMRIPYTQGGLLDNQPAYLNELGMMNSGFYMKSNTVKHNIKGNDWYVDDVLVAKVADTGMEIINNLTLTGLPTTLPGTPGKVWNDAGTLKIS